MVRDPLTHALAAAMRASFLAANQLQRVEGVLGGLTLAALPPRKLNALTARLYAVRGRYHAEGLFGWEERWFADDLPPAPARILVGGAGSGREVKALLGLGYEVVAFDPAPSFVARARRHLRGDGMRAFTCGGYEDLITSGHALKELVDGHAPYDAILLGWGSFTHMPVPAERRELLARVASLCPAGPTLLSFWLRREGSERDRGRAFSLGWRVGGLLSGRAQDEGPDPGDQVMTRCGYGHWFTVSEIAELAAAAGLQLHRAPSLAQPYAHATLRPSTPPSPSAS